MEPQEHPALHPPPLGRVAAAAPVVRIVKCQVPYTKPAELLYQPSMRGMSTPRYRYVYVCLRLGYLYKAAAYPPCICWATYNMFVGLPTAVS